ncbi:Glucosamine-6-phosphate deaminase 1 [Bacillus sp. THAF10]|uniref:glucosamine-6-phosphate deaminase n=1 Tax=Bacillus sp. THAF10 TaxID=2587848 RepID=UPI001268A3CB|nr:glucosamine-6-phosphate deaminase [Bacillus sp. THAF10]QFT88642.1 Glucosamine-6-phosphate deaminase 1 [Bacillus sp. THAF10]
MDIITTASYKEMSKVASSIIISNLRVKQNLVLGLATGSTPKGTYQYLVEDYKQNRTDYSKVKAFNLDEYIGLGLDHRNSYYSFMQKNLFQSINMKSENTFIPNGTAKDIFSECQSYENKLAQHGPIDIQLLGLGQNGHIGFNEPGTSFQSTTHLVELTHSTINANARFFESSDEVPTHAITMGIHTIMQAKKILLLISGKNKQDAFQKLLYGELSEKFPASILQTHPNVTIIADKDVLQNNRTIA